MEVNPSQAGYQKKAASVQGRSELGVQSDQFDMLLTQLSQIQDTFAPSESVPAPTTQTKPEAPAKPEPQKDSHTQSSSAAPDVTDDDPSEPGVRSISEQEDELTTDPTRHESEPESGEHAKDLASIPESDLITSTQELEDVASDGVVADDASEGSDQLASGERPASIIDVNEIAAETDLGPTLAPLGLSARAAVTKVSEISATDFGLSQAVTASQVVGQNNIKEASMSSELNDIELTQRTSKPSLEADAHRQILASDAEKDRPVQQLQGAHGRNAEWIKLTIDQNNLSSDNLALNQLALNQKDTTDDPRLGLVGLGHQSPRPQSAPTFARTYELNFTQPMAQSSEWAKGFYQRVNWLVNQNIQKAQINIEPHDLGPVKIEISMSRDQTNLVFTSHSSQVRDVLEMNAHRIREILQEQGYVNVQADVREQADQSPDQFLSQHSQQKKAGELAHDEPEAEEHLNAYETETSIVNYYI